MEILISMTVVALVVALAVKKNKTNGASSSINR
jgi:hypothetical protein